MSTCLVYTYIVYDLHSHIHNFKHQTVLRPKTPLMDPNPFEESKMSPFMILSCHNV